MVFSNPSANFSHRHTFDSNPLESPCRRLQIHWPNAASAQPTPALVCRSAACCRQSPLRCLWLARSNRALRALAIRATRDFFVPRFSPAPQLNKQLKEKGVNQHYIFHFVCPDDFPTFFNYLRNNTLIEGKFYGQLEELLDKIWRFYFAADWWRGKGCRRIDEILKDNSPQRHREKNFKNSMFLWWIIFLKLFLHA